MVVDGVSEVLRVPENAIEPPSQLVTSADSAFITGIAKVDERLVILLDLSKVLSADEKSELHSVQNDKEEQADEAPAEADQSQLERLSPRELEALQLIVEGKSMDEEPVAA